MGPEAEGKLVYFMSVDNARFRRPVFPGDRAAVHVTKQRNRGNVWKFEGRAKVGERCDGRGRVRRDDPGRLEGRVMPQIHPTAIVAPGARLAEDVVVGPYCVIGEDVALGAGRQRSSSHVVVDGRTTIGEGTRIFPFASIGLEPQDLKYRGEQSSLVIGRNNTIREYVTMNPGHRRRRHGDPGRRRLPVDGRRPCRP